MNYLPLFESEHDEVKFKHFWAKLNNYQNIKACDGKLFFWHVVYINLKPN